MQSMCTLQFDTPWRSRYVQLGAFPRSNTAKCIKFRGTITWLLKQTSQLIKRVDIQKQSFNLTINSTNAIWYYCTALSSCAGNGMVGVINVSADLGDNQNMNSLKIAVKFVHDGQASDHCNKGNITTQSRRIVAGRRHATWVSQRNNIYHKNIIDYDSNCSSKFNCKLRPICPYT